MGHGSQTPSLADIATYFIYNWMWYLKFLSLNDLFDDQVFLNVVVWLTRMQGHLASLKKISTSPEKISGEDTAKLIFSSPSEDCDIIGFDEIEAGRLQLARDDVVSVAPSDYGRTPTVGKVLALNREEIVIETRGTGGKVHCHFPRLNFTVAGPKV